MNIVVDQSIRMELIHEQSAEVIFDMVCHNREHLRTWLPFADKMQDIAFAARFVNGTMERNRNGMEYAFVLFHDDRAIGRMGVYHLDNPNKCGEIGYWLTEEAQGKGIATKACKVLIDFCFTQLGLNRLELKCGTGNLRSKAVAEKLHFMQEGIIRQGEWLHEHFIDLYLFSLLRQDVEKQ